MAKRYPRICIFAVGLLCWMPRAGVAGSCPAGSPIDYLAPLRDLPKLREIPADHRLPFAPRNLSVFPFGELLAGGGVTGFEFRSTSQHRMNRLRWTITLTVRQLSSQGAPKGITGKQTVRLRGRHSYRREPVYLGIDVPGRPGFYKRELTIKRRHHPPVTFSQYLRVLPRRFDVSLHLAQSSYLPGEMLAMRLENHGTLDVTYGLVKYLEKWNGADWVSGEEEDHFYPLIAYTLPPGTVGKCELFTFPKHCRLDGTDSRSGSDHAGSHGLTSTFAKACEARF